MVGNAAHRGDIVGERNCRECALADNNRVDKFYGNMLGIRTAPAIAKGNELATLVKSAGHIITSPGHRLSVFFEGESGRPPSPECISNRLREGRCPLGPAHSIHAEPT